MRHGCHYYFGITVHVPLYPIPESPLEKKVCTSNSEPAIASVSQPGADDASPVIKDADAAIRKRPAAEVNSVAPFDAAASLTRAQELEAATAGRPAIVSASQPAAGDASRASAVRDGDKVGVRAVPNILHSQPALASLSQPVASDAALDKNVDVKASVSADGASARAKHGRRLSFQVINAPEPELSELLDDNGPDTSHSQSPIASRSQPGASVASPASVVRVDDKVDVKAVPEASHSQPAIASASQPGACDASPALSVRGKAATKKLIELLEDNFPRPPFAGVADRLSATRDRTARLLADAAQCETMKKVFTVALITARTRGLFADFSEIIGRGQAGMQYIVELDGSEWYVKTAGDVLQCRWLALHYGEQEHAFTYNKARAAFSACICLLYTSPSPRDLRRSRMPSSA